MPILRSSLYTTGLPPRRPTSDKTPPSVVYCHTMDESTMNRDDEFTKWVSHCHPDLFERCSGPLNTYYHEILSWNKVINLISRKSPESTAAKLIVDALFLLRLLQGNETIIDIGAGAGLPSIPLLLCSNLKITLVESRLKRAIFLNHIVNALALRNASVVHEKADEKFFIKNPARYDIFWSKATLPFGQLLKLAELGLREKGKIFIFKAFEKKKERESLKRIALNHRFAPPVYKVFSCPDAYLTRTVAICQKATDTPTDV